MKQDLRLTIDVLQKSTEEVYTWFECLTNEETIEVLKDFIEQVNNNAAYEFVSFTKNVLLEMNKTKTNEELFNIINNSDGNNIVTDQVESHPLYKTTKLSMAYFYKNIITFYKQHPKDAFIKELAKEFFKIQYDSGIMEKGQWGDTDILHGAKF